MFRRKGSQMLLACRNTRAPIVLALVCTALALAISACGSSSSTSSSGSGSSGSSGSGQSSAAQTKAIAEAKADIAPVTGHPSPFPVTSVLPTVPKGKQLVYIDCSAPFCSLLDQFISNAASQMGMKYKTVAAGSSSQGLTQAWNAAVQLKPAAVIAPPTEPQAVAPELKELKALHIPVVTTGWVNGLKAGAAVSINDTRLFDRQATLEADWIIAHLGFKANAVFYYSPELAFTQTMVPAFESEMHRLCPSCTVRAVQIPLATLGTTSAQLIVNDLQAHPQTNVSASDDGDPYDGLPSALKTAGRKITLVSTNGTPITWGYVKDGEVATDLAGDTQAAAYETVGAAAWAIDGAKIPPNVSGLTPIQFLTPNDITPTVLKEGWSAYPNNAGRWAKLWGLS